MATSTTGAANVQSGDFSPLSGTPLWIAGSLLARPTFEGVLDTALTKLTVPTIAGGRAVPPRTPDPAPRRGCGAAHSSRAS